MNSQVIIHWIGAICTFGILTVLYNENKVFRFFEHVFIGVATGYEVFILWRDVLYPNWYDPMVNGKSLWSGLWMLTAVAGVLYFTIYSEKYSWMSRLIIGSLLGVAAGQEIQRFVGEVVPQMRSTFNPLVVYAPNADNPQLHHLDWPSIVNRSIYLFIFLSVMTYFFFSFEHRAQSRLGPLGMVRTGILTYGSRAGRWLLMISFGAVFGNTIMARFSLFISRLQFLVTDWWPVLKFWEGS